MNIIASIITVILSYACGRLFGMGDADKPSIKHDGRRFAYRAALIGAVCAFVWWRTEWQWWNALLTWAACGCALSIGVRFGFNTSRNVDKFYISAGNSYDLFYIRAITGRTRAALKASHQDWYNTNDMGYAEDVHRAGEMATTWEGAFTAVCLVAECIIQYQLLQ